MDFDDYCKNYSGCGVIVTIIDTGVTLDRVNIAHYRYKNGKITNCDDIAYDNKHGTLCAEKILHIAPNVELHDICVEEKGTITESAMVCALNFANDNLKSDIICICLALNEYSIELAEILRKFEKTFILASGHKKEVFYPSDLNDVIKVYYDSDISGVEIVSENTIAINYEEIQSSSSACAHASGLFSLILEAKALWRFDDIKNLIFPYVEKPVLEHNPTILPEKFVARFPTKYLKYQNIFIDNLVGCYGDDMSVHDFNGIQLSDSYKTIYINADGRKKVISPTVLGDYFAGYFNCTLDKKIQLQNHYTIVSNYICDVAQPIVVVASFGYGASKFDLQLKSYNNISKLGYKVRCTTYNPMGILFNDFTVFEYPEQIICPKLIYSINNFIYETSITNNTDIFILNVGGSIREINYHNPYDMGMLFEVYMKALKIDIVFLCVNINVSIDVVLFEVKKLKATGVSDIIVIISENQYDYSSYKTSKGMRYFKCSKDKQESYAEKLRGQYYPDLVYLLDDLDSLDVNETIVKKFT